ncbi:MAG TPA: hypothetical protein VKF38_11165 [Anaerolineaceae bacterium]|nr:hypothetical protein [Anaerolineaceae bacterium]
MTSRIDTEKFFEWARIPVEQLENHPDAKVKIKILANATDVIQWAARYMVDEVKNNNKEGKPTRWILPCGPTGQYPIFTQIVNEERINMRNVHIFHMDDFLDWQGRPLPIEHPLCFRGEMTRLIYDQIDTSLNVPESQRHFPSIYDIDGLTKEIEKVGGIDTMLSGIGYRGHIAYNEPPIAPWNTITEDDFRNSKTRILNLNPDTIIAMSQRVAGGLLHYIPPMAITMGMKDLLSAKRIRLLSITGEWKRAIIRYLLFGPKTIEYPVTFVQDHPDVLVVADRNTVLPCID